MNSFCTFFDSNYLSRGVAMAQSLRRHLGSFELFVFPFDEPCRRTLERLRLPGVTVVPVEELEDDELRKARANRPWVEYLWSCTPSTILYVLERVGREACTYLDADLAFFASPQPLLDELGDDAILLTEHRYTPRHDRTATSGRFCVQFMTFRGDADGLGALRWWRQACLESTALDPENGKCGDQKYLDDWPERFARVRVLEHLGGGVAPWNVQQYRFERRGSEVWGTETASGRRFPLVFYHFHDLKFLRRSRVRLTGELYELERPVVDLIYRPYLGMLEEAKRAVLEGGETFDPHGTVRENRGLRGWLGSRKRRLLAALRSPGMRRVNFNDTYRIRELTR